MSLDLDAIKARCEAATEGPWVADGLEGNLDSPVGRVAEVGMWAEVDAQFIAAARTDVSALIAEVERLRDLASSALALHVRHDHGGRPYPLQGFCCIQEQAGHVAYGDCAVCSEPWPCQTRILASAALEAALGGER